MEGRSLRQKLDQKKQLSLDDALRITREVVSALDYAHIHAVRASLVAESAKH